MRARVFEDAVESSRRYKSASKLATPAVSWDTASKRDHLQQRSITAYPGGYVSLTSRLHVAFHFALLPRNEEEMIGVCALSCYGCHQERTRLKRARDPLSRGREFE